MRHAVRGYLTNWQESMLTMIDVIRRSFTYFHPSLNKLAALVLLQALAVSMIPSEARQSQQDDLVYYTQTGKAEFTSRVPLHTFTGESGHLVGMIDLKENAVDFYLDLRTIETGIDRRDRDMFRTLQVDEHPFAEFTGTMDPSVEPAEGNWQPISANGRFTVHGVTRDVRINGKIKKQSDSLLLEAEWELNIEDYDIDPPGILFYRVNEIQEVRIEVVLEPRPRSEILGNG